MNTFLVTHLEPGDTLHLDMAYNYPTNFCTRNGHTSLECKLLIDFHGGKSFFFDGRYCTHCERAYVNRNYYASTINPQGEHDLNIEFVLQDGSLLSEVENEQSYGYDKRDFPERANRSLLNKLGYNVGQTDDLSDRQRQAILRDIIERGEMTQGYICSHLKYLIKINGQRDANWLAVQKWKRDLEFVQNLGAIKKSTRENTIRFTPMDDDELPF